MRLCCFVSDLTTYVDCPAASGRALFEHCLFQERYWVKVLRDDMARTVSGEVGYAVRPTRISYGPYFISAIRL